LILLIARSEEVGREIRRSLGDECRVIEARDGEQGFRQAQENVPDAILTEMDLPGVNGMELCRRLKSNDLVSHIPVIMLSSPGPEDSQIKALEAGADDYLAQPLSLPLLKARVEKLLRSRRQLYDPFSEQITSQPRDSVLTSADAQFLRRAIDTVERHLPDFEFDVDLFAQKMAASKRQLLRKLKAVAGCTPKAFIRTLRLKRAAQLLKESSMTVSEITYAVGFCDLKHFRTLFKEQFGVLPVDYAARPNTAR
jgi:DNA-binding response OmpR family regulator